MKFEVIIRPLLHIPESPQTWIWEVFVKGERPVKYLRYGWAVSRAQAEVMAENAAEKMKSAILAVQDLPTEPIKYEIDV